MAKHDLDRFTTIYVDTALEHTVDDNGAFLGAQRRKHLAPETVRQMRFDCVASRLQAGDTADQFGVMDVAFDFWMERNQSLGFGGFGVDDHPRDAARELARIARSLGPCELYLDDDGLIHSR